jgi:uncharacterized membrane protein YdjX (TVP38/TMEM64 family)
MMSGRTQSGAWRRWIVAFVLFGGLGLLLLFGAPLLGSGGAGTARAWMSLARGPWALPAAVAAFAVLAFLGVPQFALIAAAVVAFGPWQGAIYSWIGTMVSAAIGFGLGRGFGARLLRDLPGAVSIDRFTNLIARNGFAASLVVRLVPFAPFVVVNMAAGITSMRTAAFLAGTGLGIIPKIGLTAFAGRSAQSLMGGGGGAALGMLAGAVAVWVAAGVAARRWIASRRGG